ncbi:MAG: hypothetical protein Tsb0013_09620 [Phycisphaerales bacterium]
MQLGKELERLAFGRRRVAHLASGLSEGVAGGPSSVETADERVGTTIKPRELMGDGVLDDGPHLSAVAMAPEACRRRETGGEGIDASPEVRERRAWRSGGLCGAWHRAMVIPAAGLREALNAIEDDVRPIDAGWTRGYRDMSERFFCQIPPKLPSHRPMRGYLGNGKVRCARA